MIDLMAKIDFDEIAHVIIRAIDVFHKLKKIQFGEQGK
jgi:hypothetical protein